MKTATVKFNDNCLELEANGSKVMICVNGHVYSFENGVNEKYRAPGLENEFYKFLDAFLKANPRNLVLCGSEMIVYELRGLEIKIKDWVEISHRKAWLHGVFGKDGVSILETDGGVFYEDGGEDVQELFWGVLAKNKVKAPVRNLVVRVNGIGLYCYDKSGRKVFQMDPWSGFVFFKCLKYKNFETLNTRALEKWILNIAMVLEKGGPTKVKENESSKVFWYHNFAFKWDKGKNKIVSFWYDGVGFRFTDDFVMRGSNVMLQFDFSEWRRKNLFDKLNEMLKGVVQTFARK